VARSLVLHPDKKNSSEKMKNWVVRGQSEMMKLKELRKKTTWSKN